jgi:ech hydrogenase subunit A
MQYMDVANLIRSVSPGTLIGILVLLPALSGLMVFALRRNAVRVGIVILTAWVVTGASLMLFLWGAMEQRSLPFTPPPLSGVSWDRLIFLADGALLLLFCILGIVRRSPLIFSLALLQALGFLWLEAGIKPPHTESAPLIADWLAIIMVLIVSIIGMIIATYALPYMRDHEARHQIHTSRKPRFFLFLLLFLGAMNGLLLADNLLWLACFWELTTLCSFMLIRHDGTEEAQRNADRALWMNLLGGVAMIAGILLLAGRGEPLSVRQVLANSASGAATQTALLLPMACFCLAGFTKSAQMPFQNWLLGAMVAPTPVSALLHSSTMVKAGVYLIVRFAPAFHNTYLSDMVAFVGGFSFVAGAFLAIGKTNAKAVLAYSTISNLGLIIACVGLNTPLAMTGAVMLIIFHSISKGMLFMATGVVEQHIHTRDIEEMQGLVSTMPLTTSLMVIGILSMLLPPFGVLIAKLVALEASIQLPVLLILLILGSTMTVVFWTKWTGRLLTSAPSTPRWGIERLHSMYLVPLLLLTSGAVIFSLLVVPVLTQLVIPAVTQYYQAISPTTAQAIPMGEVLRFPWLPFALALLAAVLIPLWIMRARKPQVREVYLCGEQVSGLPTVTFRAAGEEKTELLISGYYFESWVGEETHRRWMTAVGVVLCILLFGTASLWK